jgi:hypothetical protein
MTITHLNYDPASLQERVLNQYLKISSSQGEASALERNIQRMQKQLNSLIKKYQEISNWSEKDITLGVDWLDTVVKPKYPEFSRLTVPALNSSEQSVLETTNAPMIWVYNGTHPFYITEPCLRYEMTFSREGYYAFKNTTPNVCIVKDEGDPAVASPPELVLSNTLNYRKDDLREFLTATTHPHASSETPGRMFNNICTGMDNPFREYLTGNKVKVIGDFKRGIRLALDWMRTYNVNDAYGGFTPWRCVPTRSSASMIDILSNLMAESGITESQYITSLINLTQVTYNFLKAPMTEKMPDTIGELWSPEINDEWAKLELLTTKHIPRHDGLAFPILSGLTAVAVKMQHGVIRANGCSTTDDIWNEIALDSFFINKAQVGTHARHWKALVIPYLAAWFQVLTTFKTLYATLLFQCCINDDLRIIGRDHAMGLLLRDMVAPAIEKSESGLLLNKYYLDQYLWKARQPHITDKDLHPTTVMPEYTECIKNLDFVLPASSKTSNKIVGKLLAKLL